MSDLIDRQAAIDALAKELKGVFVEYRDIAEKLIGKLPSAQPDNRLSKIADLVEGTIDHFDLDDAMDLLYQIKDVLEDELPSAQPERRCVNCGRTVNNGGWYEDGRTRCPIEEHYALPKDGYCHLWEKRKDWEDNYVKRAEEGEK